MEIVPPEYTVDTLHIVSFPDSCGYAAGRAASIDSVDSGRVIVAMYGHGWPCGNTAFHAGTAAQLNNTDELPFWLMGSCSTGDFANVETDDCGGISGETDCLGEFLMHYHTTADKGAIGFFGATEPTAQLDIIRHAFEGLFISHYPMVGQATAYAKLRVLQECGGYDQGLYEYNLLCDPALDLFLS